MPSPLVISVVLNTNHCEDTLQCLASLEQNSYTPHQIILLDNASNDGSVEAVRASFPKVQIIQLTENLGYAGNNNVGIDAAISQGADWVFVLNEDTILAPECISQLVACGESDAKIGVVGPLVFHYDEPGVIQSAGGKMDATFRGWHIGENEVDQGQFKEPCEVDWISGCGILVRGAVINQVGTIDARFFYYVEEFEWCVRAKEAGWKIINAPGAKMWHKGVQRNYQPKPSVTYYATRNRLLVLAKHHASAGVWIRTWFQMARTLISWSIRPKWRSKREHRDAMWKGVVDFLNKRWGKMS
jgi:GT2 family glycosyltransferase